MGEKNLRRDGSAVKERFVFCAECRHKPVFSRFNWHGREGWLRHMYLIDRYGLERAIVVIIQKRIWKQRPVYFGP
jgi:hypothetical protein